MSYSTADIRQFLADAFSDEELNTFCFDRFPEVYNGFAIGMTKGQKIQLLIEYGQRREKMADLVAALKEARPAQFARRFPDGIIAVSALPEAESPDESLDEEVNRLVLQAQGLLTQRRFDEAVRLMRQHRERHTGHTVFDGSYLEVLYQCGVHWYFDHRDLPKAEQAFQEVVEIEYTYKQAATYLRDIKRRLALPEAAPAQRRAAPVHSRRAWMTWGVAIISLLACVAAWLVVPEFRQFLGLDRLTPTPMAVDPTHTATSTPRLIVTPTPSSPPKPNSSLTPSSAASSVPVKDSTPASPSTPASMPVSIGTSVPMPVEVISTANADQLALLARWGKGKATQLMYSPDGKYLAVLSSRGAYLYDVQTRQELRFIPSPSIYYSAAFVPLADTLLVSQYESVNLVPLSGNSPPDNIGVDHWVSSVAASPDGEWLAVGQDGGSYGIELQLWQWKKSFVPAFTRDYPAPIRSLAFSPDSQTLAVGLKDGTIHLLKWQNPGQSERVLSGHTESVWSLAFSPKGTWLASGGDDGTYKVWRWQELTGTIAYSGTYKGNVYGVAFGSGGTEGWLTLALGGGENKVRVVPATNEVNQPPPFDQLAYPNSVLSVAYAPDGNTLGIVTGGSTVELRQAANGRLLASLNDFTQGSIGDLIFVQNDQALWSGMFDDVGIRQWQVANGQSDFAVIGDLSTGRIAASPDLRYAAAPIWDHYVRVWNSRAPAVHQDWNLAPDHDPRRVAFSSRGLMAVGDDLGTIWVWKMPNDTPLFTLTQTSAMTLVNAIEFSPNGEFLAAGAEDGTAQVWQMADRSLAFALPPHPKAVNDVTFSPDGTLLATSMADGLTTITEMNTRQLVRTFDNGDVQAESLAFSPNGDLLAVSLSNGNVKIWAVSNGDLLATLDAHNTYVRGLAFSSNGRLLATGADDATIDLWGIPPPQ